MSRLAIPAALALLATAGACATGPRQLALRGPDCRPMVASVILTCWYGGRTAPLGQCDVGAEKPAGCGIGAPAMNYFNSGIDMSPIYYSEDVEDRPRWVQIQVFQDKTGRVGRRIWTENNTPLVAIERPFGAK